jgi:hypothetical protein
MIRIVRCGCAPAVWSRAIGLTLSLTIRNVLNPPLYRDPAGANGILEGGVIELVLVCIALGELGE